MDEGLCLVSHLDQAADIAPEGRHFHLFVHLMFGLYSLLIRTWGGLGQAWGHSWKACPRDPSHPRPERSWMRSPGNAENSIERDNLATSRPPSHPWRLLPLLADSHRRGNFCFDRNLAHSDPLLRYHLPVSAWPLVSLQIRHNLHYSRDRFTSCKLLIAKLDRVDIFDDSHHLDFGKIKGSPYFRR